MYMEIKTKYEIGQKIWIVYQSRGEVHLYSDEIVSIIFEDGRLIYMAMESSEELKEEDIILYDETERLLAKIKEIDEKGE